MEGGEKLAPGDRNWKLAAVQKLFTNAWCHAGLYTQYLAVDESMIKYRGGKDQTSEGSRRTCNVSLHINDQVTSAHRPHVMQPWCGGMFLEALHKHYSGYGIERLSTDLEAWHHHWQRRELPCNEHDEGSSSGWLLRVASR